MEPLFYSTGQAARELGTSLALIRILCENRAIAAETTPGGHWRLPAAVVERLKRDGLPQIPRPLPTQSAPPARNGTADRDGHTQHLAKPSDEVVSAADQLNLVGFIVPGERVPAISGRYVKFRDGVAVDPEERNALLREAGAQ